MMGNIDNIYPNFLLVFLKALDYPDYARPEYFIREQKKSGWGKGIFLHTLMGVRDHFSTALDLSMSGYRSRLKRENEELPKNFGLDLAKHSEGQMKGTLTKELLEDLRYSIINAYRVDKPKPIFDSYQIIAFCEKMFIYIRAQFKEQIQKTDSARYLAARQRKEGYKIEGDPEYVIYHYNIISDAPVVDFYILRNEVRKLLLNSIHPDELKTMLKPLYMAGVEIVNLWNNKLQPIEVAPDQDALKKVIRDQRLVSFDPNEMIIWNRNTNSQEDFHREPSKHFMNQDFAAFAANVANLISGEILKLGKTKRDQKVENSEHEDFDDLFIKRNHILPSYNILKNEGLLGEKQNYIGKLKSAFCIWANELRSKNIIRYVPDQTLTVLLNRKFDGLKMANSNFRADLTTATKRYQKKFRIAMDELS